MIPTPHQLPIAHQINAGQYSLKHDTFVEVLAARARTREEVLTFMDMSNTPHPLISTDMMANARIAARYLIARGLQKNDKVILMLPTSLEFVYLFFGILLAGGVPVPISHPTGAGHQARQLAHIAHIALDCEAKFFITFQRMEMITGTSDELRPVTAKFVFSDDIFHDARAKTDKIPFPQVSADDAALVQYTSGTTSRPKGVVLSHKNLIHNIHAIGISGALKEDDISISWLPLYHDMGLIGILLFAVYWGNRLILMRPEAFIFRPQWWLENISRFKATFSVAPNFGYHYCTTRIKDSLRGKVSLHSWRVALNGAEPVDPITLEKFYNKFRSCGLRPDLFLPVYGMAENSLATTFPSLDERTVIRRFDRQRLQEAQIAMDCASDDSRCYIDLVSVGHPIIGQQIRIADPQGLTLSEREVGEILIKSPSMTQGYYKNAEATCQTLKDGWLHTGDLGFMLDGRLFISGRIKEMIIKRGRNIYPYDVERIAASVNGIRLGSTAAFAADNHDTGTEDLVLVCETIISDPERIADLRKEIDNKILSTLGFRPDRIVIATKGTIPKTTSGKIQRVAVKKMYLDGTLFAREAGSYAGVDRRTAIAVSR